MNTILQIIENHGGIETLKEKGHIKIKLEYAGVMPLSIDYLGTGPHGYPMIAVAHNYIQNGDVMADPDMQLEIVPSPEHPEVMDLEPLTYQQDGLGLYQSVYNLDENGKAKSFYPKLRLELLSFLKTWSRNLREQGFLEVPIA